MKPYKVISLILGVISLIFGSLKLVDPFKSWYAEQIASSGLPHFAYGFGIAGECLAGLLFLLPFLLKMPEQTKKFLLIGAHASWIVILITATIIHLIPTVSAEVLPLKIKPPVIPIIILIITMLNLRQIIKIEPVKGLH